MNHQTLKPRARNFYSPTHGPLIRVYSKLGSGFGYTLDEALREYHVTVRLRANSKTYHLTKLIDQYWEQHKC